MKIAIAHSSGGGYIVTANDKGEPWLNSKIIAKVDACEGAAERAAAICAVVNAHEGLVEALKWVQSSVKHKVQCPVSYDKPGSPCHCGMGHVDRALAAAEPKGKVKP